VDLSVNKSSLGRGEPVLLQVPRYNPLLSVASSPPISNAAPEPSDLKSVQDIKQEQGKVCHLLYIKLFISRGCPFTSRRQILVKLFIIA